MKKIVLLLLILIGLATWLPAQQTNPKELKAYKDSVEHIIKGLDNKINDSNEALKKANSVYESAKEHISLSERFDTLFLGVFGLGIAIIGAIIGIIGFNLYQTITDLKRIKNDLRNKIVDDLKADKSILDEWMSEGGFKRNIKANKKILIISKMQDDGEPYKDLLKRGYKGLSIDVVDDRFQLKSDIANFDIIIFDNKNKGNSNWNLNDVGLKQKVIAIGKDVFSNDKTLIYYGDKKYDGEILEDLPTLKFCNVPDNLENLIINSSL